MSNNKEKSRSVVLKPDALCSRLAPDPGNLPNLRTEFGFLGPSVVEGSWRLYSGLNFDNYIEVRDADIIHSESMASDTNPMGGTILWLARDAVISRTSSEAREAAESDFLQGPLMNEFLRGTGVNSLVGSGPQEAVWTVTVSSKPCIVTIIVIYSAAVCGGPGTPRR